MIGAVLRKNIVFITVTVLVFSLLAYFVTTLFITKHYTSKASLYVDTKVSEDPNYNAAYSLNMQTYAQRLVFTYIRMLDTDQFYEAVSENLMGRYTPAELSKMISFNVSDSPTESKLIGDVVCELAPKRISSLKSNAELKVCDPAQVPERPSSPNTTKNVLIAFAIGLILSVAISFIRYFMDKKIKYDEEMTEIFGIPILATIPNFDDYINKKKK